MPQPISSTVSQGRSSCWISVSNDSAWHHRTAAVCPFGRCVEVLVSRVIEFTSPHVLLTQIPFKKLTKAAIVSSVEFVHSLPHLWIEPVSLGQLLTLKCD